MPEFLKFLPIFNGPLNTSPCLPPFRQNVRLPVPIIIRVAPAAHRASAPCFGTTGASDGSRRAAGSSGAHHVNAPVVSRRIRKELIRTENALAGCLYLYPHVR